jgi:hypothetical protein
VEADVIEGIDFKIEPLRELPRLSQTVERVKVDYKGTSTACARKYLKKSKFLCKQENFKRWVVLVL